MDLSEVGVDRMDALFCAQEQKRALLERLQQPASDADRASIQAQLKPVTARVSQIMDRIQT